ncbi:head GIN domain-containing protein [Pedobacter sp. PWIIR3]
MKIAFLNKTTAIILHLIPLVFVSKAQESKSVALRDFQEVSITSGIDLYITQSTSESIKIVAHPDILEKVVIEKKGSLLNIHYKENFSWSRFIKDQDTKIYISVKTLHAISASGGSDVYTQNTIKTDKLMLHASGGSDIDFSLNSRDLQIETSGGSDINLKGSATNMLAKASGGSDIDALGLVVEYAKVEASGGSDANVNVSKALEIRATGGSDVSYKGNAVVRKTSSDRSGDVKRLN